MSESDEDKFLLDDDSMDEVHELDDELQVSVDTNASPTKSRQRVEDSDASASGLSDLDEGSDSEESDYEQRSGGGRGGTAPMARRRDDSDSGDESDEPPEIPGSPLRTMSPDQRIPNPSSRESGGMMNRLADSSIGRCGEISRQRLEEQSQPTVDILEIRHSSDEDDDGGDVYEMKEAEQPRSMEIHGSSSSSSDDDDDDDDNNNQNGQRTARSSRPKTAAATDIENYRDLIPTAYLEQKGIGTTGSTQIQPVVENSKAQPKSVNPSQRKYKFRVPQEIEYLFKYVSEYNPEELELSTRLEPFVPDYVPSIGLPFDGIQIPRPDGKPDDVTGIQVVREPSVQSNVAELELLLSAAARKQRRQTDTKWTEMVHSIDDALHRPREIDQWIASVAKVQSTKPALQVIYKKPMPSLTTLMEIWPEEMEATLTALPTLPVSRMSLSLPELVRVVCGVLDIPVHDGQHIASLHVLFSLYHEIIMYEKEMGSQWQGGT